MNTPPARVASIDIVRGLIVVLMALDHTRMFFSSAQFDPLAIDETTWGYFLTRWVTHLCAPGFFFFAGFSVALAESAGQSGRRSAFLLLTRGAWLIVLELSLIGFAWSFILGWSWFGVIWSLGLSMICLATLRWLPKLVLFVLGIAFTALHNAIPVEAILADENLRAALLSAGFVGIEGLGRKLVLFPLLPWLALMVVGYAAAPWLAPGGRPHARRFWFAGAGALVLFVGLRAIGLGEAAGGVNDLAARSQNALNFLNVEKYPPSLQFSLMTLGLLFACVAGVESLGERAKRVFPPLLVFGGVPFFFYVMHLFLIHALALATATMLKWPSEFLFWRGAGPNLTPPDGYGVGLSGVYIVWIAVLALLFPLCAAFLKHKQTSRALWTKYL